MIKNISKTMRAAMLCVGLFMSVSLAHAADVLSSPDGHLKVTVGVKGGKPFYMIARDGKPIVNRSFLGFTLNDGAFYNGFKVIGKSRDTKNETWTQPWGEDRVVNCHYNELKLHLQQSDKRQRQLNIVFRAFNDGIGFRYEFPKQKNLGEFRIMDEMTQIAMPTDAQAWTEPTNGTTYYEALWTKDLLSKKDTVSTPITIEVNDSLYMALHEANLTDYASINYTPRQLPGAAVTLVTALTPWQNGVKVYAKTPFVSPWRTILITKRPGDLITSKLMLNLNEPCKIADTSWITTGKYVGIWWGMHMEDYTWAQGPKHGATTDNTKRYIDFAAKHGMNGVLVEGWNYGWDGDWTKEGDKFDFSKPYPDYDLEGLQKYALSKGVRLIAHNETGGAAKNFENQLDSAFSLYHRLGIRAIKTGYVNALLDNKELQHSQYGVRHYRKVVETAAKYHLMVVNHEPAMPSGLCRTYPNLVSGEGMRGQEYNAWSPDGGNPPYHICVLPFTRGLAGSMDFTPGIFNFENKVKPTTHPQTTLAKQLSEYILIYSPWQMAADMIENYENQPAFSFIESVPTDWEKSLVLDAEIGKYIAMARKDKASDDWYVGAATDADARDLNLKLDFLDKDRTYYAEIYADGEGADYRTNPYPILYKRLKVTNTSNLSLHLAPSGGSAIRIKAL
ncbi:glycoside hydrolase family 97 protein [Segatella sp.]|uniref:glycoside hydrolase family 97 protein n=1 Tax=Segatella sp. TaxID=2974253 RepID=UPI003AAEB6C9